MKRKSLILLVMFISATMLFGCGSKIPEMSQEDEEVVTRYMADCLLRHEVTHTETLLSDKEKEAAELEREETRKELKRIKQEEEKKKAEEQAALEAEKLEVVGPNKQDSVLTDIDEFLGISGFDIEYSGYQICNQYPESGENMFFAMKATEGHRLLIVSFTVTNKNNAVAVIDIQGMENRYRLKADQNDYESTLMTLLDNDLSYLDEEFGAGASKECVLVIEVPDIETLNELKLQIKNTSTKMTGIFALET